jgi:nitrate reductase gamma subunit
MLKFQLFTELQGVFLVKLLLAHLVADFLLQTKKMVANKKWLSKSMFIHISIVFLVTLLLSKNIFISATIAIFHYCIDGMKLEFNKKNISRSSLFLVDQASHFLVILLCWSIYFDITREVYHAFLIPFENYQLSLILLGYVVVTTPFGYLIGLLTKRFQNQNNDDTKTDKNGLLIGIFERLIILSFMLVGEYAAIGFLITGKSIIRFSTKNEDIKSEYVLLGTFMSYALTIMLGILIKSLW